MEKQLFVSKFKVDYRYQKMKHTSRYAVSTLSFDITSHVSSICIDFLDLCFYGKNENNHTVFYYKNKLHPLPLRFDSMM